jgi:hypothetical protein
MAGVDVPAAIVPHRKIDLAEVLRLARAAPPEQLRDMEGRYQDLPAPVPPNEVVRLPPAPDDAPVLS